MGVFAPAAVSEAYLPACRLAAETAEADRARVSLTAPKPRCACFRSDRDQELPALPAQDSLEDRVARDIERPVHDEIDVVPPVSWRVSLCGCPIGGRRVLVGDGAHHAC